MHELDCVSRVLKRLTFAVNLSICFLTDVNRQVSQSENVATSPENVLWTTKLHFHRCLHHKAAQHQHLQHHLAVETLQLTYSHTDMQKGDENWPWTRQCHHNVMNEAGRTNMHAPKTELKDDAGKVWMKQSECETTVHSCPSALVFRPLLLFFKKHNQEELHQQKTHH